MNMASKGNPPVGVDDNANLKEGEPHETNYVCHHEYVAEKEDELHLKVGQVVKVTNQDDPNWWVGENVDTKESGWFPSNFVELISTSNDVADEIDAMAKPTLSPKLARVEHDYEAKASDELSLWRGGVVTVLEQNDGWWKGDLNGKIGSFPSNFVSLIEVPEVSGKSEEGGEDEDDKPKPAFKLAAYGVKQGGIGSLFSGGPPVLKKTSKGGTSTTDSGSKNEEKTTARHVAKPPVLPSSGQASVERRHSAQVPIIPAKPPSVKRKIKIKALVIYDYKAEGDDEISLTKDSSVYVLDKLGDQGWWKGTNEDGETGIFPANFVEEVTAPEELASPEEVAYPEEMTSPEKVTSPEEVMQDATSPPYPNPDLDASAQEEFKITEGSPTSQEIDKPEPYKLESPSSPVHESPTSPHTRDAPKPPPVPRATRPSSSHSQVRRTSNVPDSPTPANDRPSVSASKFCESPTEEKPTPPSHPPPKPSTSLPRTPSIPSRRPPSMVAHDLPPTPVPRDKLLSQMETSTETSKSPSPPLAKPPPIRTMSKGGIPLPGFTTAKPPPVPKPPIRRPSTGVSPKTGYESADEDKPQPESSSESIRSVEEQGENSVPPDEQLEEQGLNSGEDEKQQGEGSSMVIVDLAENTALPNDEIGELDVDEGVSTPPQENEDAIVDEAKDDHSKQPELPELPSGPKLPYLAKGRPALKGRRKPSSNNVNDKAGHGQSAALEEAVAAAPEEESKQEVKVPPPKPEKPVKPIFAKFPTPFMGAGIPNVQLRPVSRKSVDLVSPVANDTSTTASSPSDTSVETSTTGGVKSLSSRFQFGGVPNSSDMEFKLKKWFKEEMAKEMSKLKSELQEERAKREELETEVRRLHEAGVPEWGA